MISIDEHHEAIACVSDIDLDLTNNNNPLPNFSIRDYVYGSRCKDIACNWPFSSESLQLCLKSGVTNLLPPIESSVAKNRLVNEEIVRSLDVKSTDDRIIKIASSSIGSQCLLEEKFAQVKSNSQPTVMKLNSGVELVKEIIASKVCPVCKTFSSSSNNTLNAHIDRCLSGETSMKLPESPKVKTVKHRIKPRNTRLMLDIYKTAPHCTIEELDRRNGTNWATNSSFPDQELEFQAEENQDEPQEPTFVPEIAEHDDHEGDVYIDKNGTKVRILSTQNFSKLDDNEARILQKVGKKIKLATKKKKEGDVQKSRRKILKKLSPSRSKILSKKISKKIVEKHVISGQEENDAIEKSCNKEDEGEKPTKTQGHKRMEGLAIIRPPWACSKRTGLAKKRKFQDSLKQKSRMEEDTREKLSYDHSVNDLEVKKKKSVTSNSSNENYSSGRVEITSESVGIDQVPFQGSFTGLRNSLDDEFSKMVSQPDNNFDTQDDIKNQGSYFEDVEPIPIPGPPGSFLPLSPGADDMVSEEEEVQGNSSLTTTSRVQSNDQDHNHNDMMKRDFISDSPISNVSSPTPQDKKSVNTSDLRSVDAIFTEKGPTPCRCSRKEGAYHQESSERVIESNMRPNSLNFRPDLLSLILPAPQTFKSPADSSINLPVSPTTPVLRLMGKNLIVVNITDEQFRPPLGSSPMGHQPFHDIENHNSNLFYGYSPQHGSMSQYNNYHPPSFSRSLSDLRPVHALDKMFPHRTNGLMAPSNYHRLDTNMETDVNLQNALAKATKEIVVVSDSSENEADDHMFNDHMRRNQTSYIPMHDSHTLTETRSLLPTMSHMSSTSTTYYQHSFSLPTTRREDRV